MNPPELLAPAGNIEGFFAALDNGADAIYVGYRHLNARALAANFNLEDIARLNEYAHRQGVKLYVALNAAVLEEEIEEIVNTLSGLSQVEPDGLIIQDGAIARLCRLHFPNLNLHASTLMTVHNSAGVEQLHSMGFQRVVLARELTIEELAHITASTTLELEIFVHGALCYSYSGLCLASSFYGGRSSVRGRCVQPCRRLYRSGRQQGYFLSPNDLSAIDLIPRLRQLRLAAFKIEGRMKPSSYVAAVVRAYRLVLDAAPGDEARAIAKARGFLKDAYGRKPTQGFLLADKSGEIITPHRSGASGRLAAKVEWVRGNRMGLKLSSPLALGDRLRLDSDEEVEKTAFTIREIVVKGKHPAVASTGTVISVPRIRDVRRGDRVFKTGSKLGKNLSAAKLRRLLKEKTSKPQIVGPVPLMEAKASPQTKKLKPGKRATTLYLRLSHLPLLNTALESNADYILLQATKFNLNSLSKRRMVSSKKNRLFWGLPAIIHQKDLEFYREQVGKLQQMGHNRWLVANWAHFRLFTRPPDAIIADYTFNVLNSHAALLLNEMGCQRVILSLENDQDNLKKLAAAIQRLTPLATVFGWPSLFTSRLRLKPREGSTIWGSKTNRLQHDRQSGLTLVRSDLPLCLFDYLTELAKMGVVDFVVDLRGQKFHSREFYGFLRRLEEQRCPQGHSTFNYLGKLM
ncbi:MAG: U32 family peptidase [Deltaproteobacteria bacterium]|nr:U32 family peptidase [Deltaproteobacteria bacterium]